MSVAVFVECSHILFFSRTILSKQETIADYLLNSACSLDSNYVFSSGIGKR